MEGTPSKEIITAGDGRLKIEAMGDIDVGTYINGKEVKLYLKGLIMFLKCVQT